MPKYPKFKTKTIPYKDAPSGFVFIGKYKPPFMKVKGGYGYQGILMLDKVNDLLQCHICGKWFENLGGHLRIHKIKTREYQELFGLFRATALVNERMRAERSKVMIKMKRLHPRKHGTKFAMKNWQAANRKGWKKPVEGKNRYGRCHDQLVMQVKDLAKKLKKTPSLIDLKDEYGGGFVGVLNYTFGSYPSFCREIGLVPLTSNHNPKYSKKYLIGMLKDFYKRYGRIPRCTDTKRGLLPYARYYYIYFGKGGWTKARKIAFPKLKI